MHAYVHTSYHTAVAQMQDGLMDAPLLLPEHVSMLQNSRLWPPNMKHQHACLSFCYTGVPTGDDGIDCR